MNEHDDGYGVGNFLLRICSLAEQRPVIEKMHTSALTSDWIKRDVVEIRSACLLLW